MADIELNSINKFFGKTHVIKDFSLNIKSQSFTTLVGPSGCGKSTLLRMIAGLEETNSGKISIGGEEVNNLPPKERNIAMVFQSYALYPHMTVFDNMAFGLKLEKRPKDEVKDRVHEAAKILQIEDYLLRKPKQLSGGQRQRVAIGRAITRKPKVFLFDEPLSNLDAALRVQMRIELAKLHDHLDATMVYVTHDQTEAMTLSDEIVVLDQGEISQQGKPIELYNNPNNLFVAGFIGSPAMNLLEGTISNGCFEAQNTKISGLKIEDGPVTLGFRAEDAEISKRKSEIGSTVYAMELLGDATMVTVKIKDKLVSVKADKNFRAEIGDEISFSIPAQICHLFDAKTGARLSG